MTAELAGRLVRAWVANYTRGLPSDIRRNRMDEIESDLWSQHDEADSTDRSSTRVAIEIVTRLALGIPADLAWRLEQGRLAARSMERSTAMGTKIVALLAIIGGLGLTVAAVPFVSAWVANPAAHPWDMHTDLVGGAVVILIGQAALIALSLSLGGLGPILASRYDSPIGIVAEIGAFGGVAGLLLADVGVLGAGLALFLLPGASAVVVVYMARIHAAHWSLAVIHAAAAAAFFVLLPAMAANTPIGYAAIFILGYPISWIAVGLELLGGLPRPRPAIPSAS